MVPVRLQLRLGCGFWIADGNLSMKMECMGTLLDGMHLVEWRNSPLTLVNSFDTNLGERGTNMA